MPSRSELPAGRLAMPNPVPSRSATPIPMGKATARPHTDTAAINNMLPRLKIRPPTKTYIHWRFPACCKSSRKLNPSYPILPTVKAKTTEANNSPNAKSR